MVEMKQCKGKISCGKIKPITEFKLRTDTGKYTSCCNDCLKLYQKSYHQKNIEHIKIQRQQYRDNNKENINSKQRIENMSEERRLSKIEAQKQYYQLNRETRLEYSRQYKKNNKEKSKNSENASNKKRYHNDPQFKFQELVKRQVQLYLKSRGLTKNGKSSKQQMPQSAKEVLTYIQILFSLPSNLTPDGKVWMTMNNWSKYDAKTYNENDPSTWTWQIDHIKPHSEFQYTDMECQEFKDCWDLSNLRPLNSKQNNKESNNRTPEQIAVIKQEISKFLEQVEKKVA